MKRRRAVVQRNSTEVSKSHSVAARALAVLAAFESTTGPLTVARIAQRSRLPLSTTYRLVHELETWGGLDRLDDGTYQVGMRIWELGQLAGRRLRDTAHPFLQDFFDLTHENVHIAVREGTQVLYLDKLYGSRKVPIVSRVGGRLPLHTTAVGRVLLAAEPQWFIDAYVERELEAPTERTLVDPQGLKDAIADVAAHGFSVTVNQVRVGSCSIAMPVVVDGQCVAALGVVIEATRSGEARRFLPLLKSTAERVRSALVAHPPRRAASHR
jgi:DNA-binding IclR family transcriptional regulator